VCACVRVCNVCVCACVCLAANIMLCAFSMTIARLRSFLATTKPHGWPKIDLQTLQNKPTKETNERDQYTQGGVQYESQRKRETPSCDHPNVSQLRGWAHCVHNGREREPASKRETLCFRLYCVLKVSR